MARRSVVNLVRFGNRAVSLLYGSSVRPLHTSTCSSSSQPKAGFKPGRVAVVTKTTRYEFEQQRYRYAGLSEEDLKQLLAMKGSSYSGLLERHNIHTNNVEHIVNSLQREGIEVQVVKRGEYDEEVVRWADAIISAGGDGTMLLVASKVLSKDKPVVGVNTDPERSEGHLCLPVRYTRAFPEALEKLCRGEFRWLWRQRIRVHLEGTGINPTPVDLHEQQLSLEQHSQAHRITTMDLQRKTGTLHESFFKPSLLPIRSLNEIFIGESLSSSSSTFIPIGIGNLSPPQGDVETPQTPCFHRASYYEISVDDGPWEKQKSSGLSICTGTGSKAWSYNINKLAEQAVEEVLRIGKSQTGLDIPLNHDFIEKVTDEYNESLVFSPDDRRLFYSIREPIVNRVFSSSRQRGFASKVCVRSRCWDACMVVDGGTSFEFNDGAIATIGMSEEDQLRTVLLEN
ncbi:NAD kinase 2, mitochondrial isoform X1 [Chelmon rostratus]|uniref:NAD kinase 2, mitochondrial isoform X1 n=1 Tax=Chelmon rostratus TaxID=109905 RepID=UPI001BEA2B84|nr:NAD kinase 2, mitochondrial isoform X1 [Chelmon rostratus]XP_041816699.1 NAD kinase 2, mitochondrial isoform X1 [Chelmon rostratus]XP_041816700.1 NAD kinase 2, mitochondrial isoform X1 [Chelmon rostratus]